MNEIVRSVTSDSDDMIHGRYVNVKGYFTIRSSTSLRLQNVSNVSMSFALSRILLISILPTAVSAEDLDMVTEAWFVLQQGRSMRRRQRLVCLVVYRSCAVFVSLLSRKVSADTARRLHGGPPSKVAKNSNVLYFYYQRKGWRALSYIRFSSNDGGFYMMSQMTRCCFARVFSIQ